MRNTVSYAKIDDFGLFRCEHKRGPSGQVKFAITKRRTNDSFKSLSPLRGLTQKKKKYSDCKIFGKRVSLIGPTHFGDQPKTKGFFQGLLFIVFTANMRQRGRIHLATFKQGKKVKTLQTINEASQISAIKGEFFL